MEFLFGVVVPTALTALAAAAVVFLAMARMAAEVNDIDRRGIARVVDVLKDEALIQMGRVATEVAIRNAAILDEDNAAATEATLSATYSGVEKSPMTPMPSWPS